MTASTLRVTDKTAPEVAARFDALLRYASLRLGRQLGTEVTPALSRKELADPGTGHPGAPAHHVSSRGLGLLGRHLCAL